MSKVNKNIKSLFEISWVIHLGASPFIQVLRLKFDLGIFV